jgi:hypothetical protein
MFLGLKQFLKDQLIKAAASEDGKITIGIMQNIVLRPRRHEAMLLLCK